MSNSSRVTKTAPYLPQCATFANQFIPVKFSKGKLSASKIFICLRLIVAELQTLRRICHSAPHSSIKIIPVKFSKAELSAGKIFICLRLIVPELQILRRIRQTAPYAPLSSISVKLYVIGLSDSEIRFALTFILQEIHTEENWTKPWWRHSDVSWRRIENYIKTFFVCFIILHR